ncbi:MAG: Trk system potassium transporter TrkA [Flavobacteriaceae bacterium]|nr:Trk system potassium transporter TrkA [Flavobacteriaceae bacterium]
MKIIIAGAGEVGFHLAKLLSYEAHDITLIDKDKDRLVYADTRLDIKTVLDDATSIEALKNANIVNTDLLIAVTSSETTNITICVISKRLGAKKTIARISNSEFTENKDELNFNDLGIDELISTEELATDEIKLLIKQAGFHYTHEFEGGKLTMVGITLSKTAPFVGMSVKKAAANFSGIHFMPIVIKRQYSNETIIPRGDTIFKAGDQAYFITLKEGVEELNKLSATQNNPIKNVLILGGSRIGEKTARELSNKKLNVKLIERHKARAIELAEELPDTLVIYGDGRDVELLEEENVSEMDAVIAVTGRSETNIMLCLAAKSKGVKRTIALVQNVDYFNLSKNIGIDTLINKKLLAANNIFRYIRKGEVLEMTFLNNINAEILEFKAHENSKITKKKIKDLKFPRNAIIGGVIRDDVGIIALGDFQIQKDDKVVVCCFPKTISKVEDLFN